MPKTLRSGYVGINIGRLGGSGLNGYGRSSRANDSDIEKAYYLSFNTSEVYPSYGGYNRWNGFPSAA